MTPTNHISQLVDHLFRHESGKMVSVLSRLLGLQNIETAQDIVQDTLLQAMSTWGFGGVPENPPAWLHRVARNKAIDYLRREKRFREISPQYSSLLQSEYSLSTFVSQLFLENEIEDSQLRMIFACCHPSIPEDSQIAFVLKTLCGLSANEIAKAYLTNEETIAKRIYRAKEKIRSESIQLEVPQGKELPGRLDVVLKSVYLLFNEGYNSFKDLANCCCMGRQVVSASELGKPGVRITSVFFLLFVKGNDFITIRKTFFIVGDHDHQFAISA